VYRSQMKLVGKTVSFDVTPRHLSAVTIAAFCGSANHKWRGTSGSFADCAKKLTNKGLRAQVPAR
jgi:hypothetical protein